MRPCRDWNGIVSASRKRSAGSPHGRIDSVALGESEIGRCEFEPGWRWSNDVKPIVGTAVHTTARVVALAGSDEIFVSSTTRDLRNANDLAIEPAGSFELKGLTGVRDVFRLRA